MPEVDQAADDVQRRAPEAACPACGGKSWTAQEGVFMIPLGPRGFQTPQYLVGFVCARCGYLRLHYPVGEVQ